MDIRILMHYISRGGWAMLIYPLYFMYYFISNADDTDIVPVFFCILGVPLMSTGYISTRKSQWRRTLSTLPISTKQMAGAMWMMGSGLPLLSLYTGLTAGVGYIALYEPDIAVQWNRYYAIMACGTLLATSIFIIEKPIASVSIPNKIGVLFLKSLMVIYPLFLLYNWDHSALVAIIACILAAAQFIATIFLAPYAATSEIKSDTIRSTTTAPRIVKKTDLRLSVTDRLLTQPLKLSFIFGVSLTILTLAFRESIIALSEDYQFLYIFLLFATCAVFTGWISSYLLALRSIAVLPVPVSKIVICIVAAPFLVFLPIATSSTFLVIPFSSYFIAIGIFVSMSASNIRWNPLVSVLGLNFACFLVGLILWAANTVSNLEWSSLFNIIGWLAIPFLIVAPAIWLWRMLRYSNIPYQTKTEFCDCL